MINYSFIIPHHNSPDLLNRCLDSIPEREDIQIIVVDDNSKEKLKPQTAHENVEIIYIDKEHSRGAGHARNVGLEHAKGTWVIFADADDFYTEGFIDILDNYKDKNCEAVFFSYSMIDNNYDSLPDNLIQRTIASYKGSEDQLLVIKYRNNSPWSKMVRLSIVQKHNMYFEEVVNGNDILFSLFIAYFCDNILVEKSKLYNYVCNNNSLTYKKQSTIEILCRLEHIVKHNAFNSFIGHPEWNSSIIKRLLAFIKHDLKLLLLLPKLFYDIYINKQKRNDWVNIIKNRQTTHIA